MPFDASGTIRSSVNKLLAAKGGFVIFTDAGGDFVQFALDREHRLYLFWPDVSRIPGERVTPLLAGIPHETADDGVYGTFGRDVDAAVAFTLRAFRELFGREPQKLEVEMELE